MTSEYLNQKKEEFHSHIIAARDTRDKAKKAAEREFWLAVAAALKHDNYAGAKGEAGKILGMSIHKINEGLRNFNAPEAD